MRNRKRLPSTILFILIGMMGGYFIALINQEPKTVYVNETLSAEVVKKITPSIVQINTWHQAGSNEVGTGFIVSPEGEILTSQHLVDDLDRKELEVTLNDGKRLLAEVIRKDAVNDIALIKLKSASNLKVAPWGSSDDLTLGQTVMALGYKSLHSGLVSGLDEKIPDTSLDEGVPTYLKTDMQIESGDSGGPLINHAGEVIGMSTAFGIGTESGSLAIPSKVLIEFLKNSAN